MGLGGCVTKRVAGDRQAEPAPVAASYVACAAVRDAPGCLLLRALATDSVSDDMELRAVIESGSVDVVLKHRASLTAMRGSLKPLMEDDRESQVTLKHVNSSSEPAFAAALAVAAAAQVADDPFAHAGVKPLVAKAGRQEVAPLAAIVWSNVAFGMLWNAPLIRLRGLPAIWRAVAAAPPKETALVAVPAYEADIHGFGDAALALARVVLARADASAEDRSTADGIVLLADIRAAPKGPYATAVMKHLLETCSSYGGCSNLLGEAKAAGAIDDLKAFGADLATRARRESVAGEKTIAYGAASEAFRLAGENAAALAAAREGLRFIPAAKNVSTTGRIETAIALNNAFSYEDDDVAPAIALYRAGGREEALRSGYVTGYARYRHAPVAGETPDARWVVQDNSDWLIGRLLDDLIETPSAVAAGGFYDALRCAGASLTDVKAPKLHGHLAALAALIGRAGSMRAHLGAGALSLDEEARSYSSFYAYRLAEDWRRALVIAERIGAKDDKLVAPLCGTGS